MKAARLMEPNHLILNVEPTRHNIEAAIACGITRQNSSPSLLSLSVSLSSLSSLSSLVFLHPQTAVLCVTHDTKCCF
jgi:hypothetical protein